MLKRPELFQNGYHLSYFPLSEEIQNFVNSENWTGLDHEFQKLTAKGGRLFQYLNQYRNFFGLLTSGPDL